MLMISIARKSGVTNSLPVHYSSTTIIFYGGDFTYPVEIRLEDETSHIAAGKRLKVAKIAQIF